MKKKIAVGIIFAAMSSLIVGAPVSAAHCVDEDGTSPGFSYFGTDHVQEADHAEGGNPGPHMGTSGASNCQETTGSPSERAPGQQ
ncbi:MAG: hypothetical protein ACR2JR_12565 [Rubrobacteraceae bacterium]